MNTERPVGEHAGGEQGKLIALMKADLLGKATALSRNFYELMAGLSAWT
jgi:hypothetical protein